MKIHTKKKYIRLSWKRLAQDGKINDASGAWITRVSGNSMTRDFYPQK